MRRRWNWSEHSIETLESKGVKVFVISYLKIWKYISHGKGNGIKRQPTNTLERQPENMHVGVGETSRCKDTEAHKKELYPNLEEQAVELERAFR